MLVAQDAISRTLYPIVVKGADLGRLYARFRWKMTRMSWGNKHMHSQGRFGQDTGDMICFI